MGYQDIRSVAAPCPAARCGLFNSDLTGPKGNRPMPLRRLAAFRRSMRCAMTASGPICEVPRVADQVRCGGKSDMRRTSRNQRVRPHLGHRDWLAPARLRSSRTRRFVRVVASIPYAFGAKGRQFMLFGENVGVEVRDPQLALLRHAKVAERIANIGAHHRPEELRIHGPQPRRARCSRVSRSFPFPRIR